MKKLLALACCLSSLLCAKAQNTINCDSLIKKQYKIAELKNNPQFLEELKIALLCNFDSLDMRIFMGPDGTQPLTIIAPLSVKKIGTANEGTVSMGELIETLDSIRAMPDYAELRTKVAAIMRDKKNGISDQFNANIQVKERIDKHVAEAGDKQRIIESVYAFTDYTKGLSKAKASGKPVLLYFNAHASIPARMFDDQVLRDPGIQEMINKNFEVVFLSVDDRTTLPKNKIHFSKSLKRDVKYLGDIHLELQIDEFGSDKQPMFFILDQTGKKVASSMATGIKEFTQFLSAHSN